MKLYNTLTRMVETVESLEAGKIKLFVCGPTVYDLSHLGHAKTYTQLDVLVRVLRQLGYEVFYLQNITDLDDKIISRAKEKSVDWEELRTKFETEYFNDMNSLQNVSVTKYARATDHIDDIIKQVQTLLEMKNAYVIEDGVYFEIATFPNYGRLSRRIEVQENDAQSRIDQSDQKRGWNDFCLWKFSKPGEPTWDAPFGKGRPGWHIEDTAITEHFFGPQYDIHGGAVDLIFPHHEAEIAQMEAASKKSPLVRYWTHTGFLNINDTKMSKSLKNFYTIREVLQKGYDPIAIRLFMLQSHYRSAINFTWENLDAAQNRLQSYRAMADRIWQTHESGAVDESYLKNIQQGMQKSLEDDLNTSDALTHLSQLEKAIDAGGVDSSSQEIYKSFLGWLDDILGLGLSDTKNITDDQRHLIAEREAARKAKGWTKSDELRAILLDQGIKVNDTDLGPIWSRL